MHAKMEKKDKQKEELQGKIDELQGDDARILF
jgi:hypothetical protein